MTAFAFEAEIDEGCDFPEGYQVRVVVRLADTQMAAYWVRLGSQPGAERDAIEEAMSRFADKLARAMEGS